MNKKAVIFGAAGQDGYYLSRLCENAGVSVTGVVRKGATGGQVEGDVSDQPFVSDLISSLCPNYIFQFAAVSSTRSEYLFENQRAIVSGTLNVLAAAHEHSPDSRVFIPGSALQFQNDGEPISEAFPRISENQYSLARNQSLEITRYFRGLGLKAYFGYYFHHDSPKRGVDHVAQKVATFAREFREGQSEVLEIQDPRFCKEWTFAGDTVAATWLLVNNDEVFEAVIGTGEIRSISEWIDLCFEKKGIDREKYVRSSEAGECSLPYRAESSVLRRLGWQPTVSFEQFGEMMLEEPER